MNNSYGKKFNIAIANSYGAYILNGANLPNDALIISSITDTSYNDLGAYSIFSVDDNGIAKGLSYTIKENNILYSYNDVLSMHIDNDTIISYNDALAVNVENIIDNETLLSTDNKIYINTGALLPATNSNLGVVKIDGETININDNSIYVDTLNLLTATNDTAGIVFSDNVTTSLSSDGELSVNTTGLEISTENTYGISIADNDTISNNSGIYSVNTQNLSKASNEFGISKPDNTTIVSDNGIYSVNTSALNKATTTSFGIIKPDNHSIYIDDNAFLALKNYSEINTQLSYINDSLKSLNKRYDNISSLIDTYNFNTSKFVINKFKCVDVTSAVLTKSVSGTMPNEMLQEKISTEFIVNTNCRFKINVEFEDNISPAIFMYQLNYDNIDIYPGNIGLKQEFQSTLNKDKILQLSFICKNYAANNDEYTHNTNIYIRISSIDDVNVYKEIKYTFIRFNSLYNYDTTLNTNYVVGGGRKLTAKKYIVVNGTKISAGALSNTMNIGLTNTSGSALTLTQYDIDEYNDGSQYILLDTYIISSTDNQSEITYVNNGANNTVLISGEMSDYIGTLTTDGNNTIITFNDNYVKLLGIDTLSIS